MISKKAAGTYAVVVGGSDTDELALVDTVHVQLLEDAVGGHGAGETSEGNDAACEMHFEGDV